MSFAAGGRGGILNLDHARASLLGDGLARRGQHRRPKEMRDQGAVAVTVVGEDDRGIAVPL
jgi:hypothetical protein